MFSDVLNQLSFEKLLTELQQQQQEVWKVITAFSNFDLLNITGHPEDPDNYIRLFLQLVWITFLCTDTKAYLEV